MEINKDPVLVCRREVSPDNGFIYDYDIIKKSLLGEPVAVFNTDPDYLMTDVLLGILSIDPATVYSLTAEYGWGWRLESKDQAIHFPWHVGYQSLEEAKAACCNQLLFNK